MYQTRSCNKVTQHEFEWHKYPQQSFLSSVRLAENEKNEIWTPRKFPAVAIQYTIKYKSDRDRMLAGSRSVPATGWMPVS